ASGKIVITYQNPDDLLHYYIATSAWEETLGEYGDGMGGSWNNPQEMSENLPSPLPGDFYINHLTGYGAFAYETNDGYVYQTIWKNGDFQDGEKISNYTYDVRNGSVKVGYFQNSTDNDGILFWVADGFLVGHRLDIEGDFERPPIYDEVVAENVLDHGNVTTSNLPDGQKTALIPVITNEGNGETAIRIAPINPNDIEPTISALVIDVDGTTVTITWTTDVPTGEAKVYYDITGVPSQIQEEEDSTPHYDHEIVLTDLDPDVTYYFAISQKVWGKDTIDIDSNDGIYYLAQIGHPIPSAPGMETVSFIVVATSGLAIFLALRRRK
ncbi:MAG: hypothetical protein JXA43_02955, partial [Candidatus Diapherotrites archaeon]|nr:hypothetical protein [Candidatus Diapherotrites archaeon]